MSVLLILREKVAFHFTSDFMLRSTFENVRASIDIDDFRLTRLLIVWTGQESINPDFPTRVWIPSFSFSNKADPKGSTVSATLGNLLAKVSGPVESLFLVEPAYVQTNSARILPGLTSSGTMYFSIINKKNLTFLFIIYQI